MLASLSELPHHAKGKTLSLNTGLTSNGSPSSRICAYHSTPLTVEWSVRKTFIAGLPLTQNHRRLRRLWCGERSMWAAEWNEVVSTDNSRICLQHHEGRIRVWRHRGERMLNSCVMHRHTGPARGIMVWGGIGYHSRSPLVRIGGNLNSATTRGTHCPKFLRKSSD
ncbi:transposable element Tcb1 transposase [Trichonephila clavipes]|nr:transposable element Tcb1 transposase [Trichonephila clavipes]